MLKINKEFLEDIIKHCKEEYPKEACGILAGKIVESNKIVGKVYKMKNISEEPQTCYFMEPEEQFNVFKEMRDLNLELIGIYHSHTSSSAFPSNRDINMAYYPETVYVIISLQNFETPEINGFEIIEGKIKQVEIDLKEE